MTTNFFSKNSRPFSLVRNTSPAVDRYFSLKNNQRNPRVKDSRPVRKIIMKQMDQNIDHKLKLISCGIEIQKNQWMRKIQRVFGDKSFSRGSKIIVKDLEKLHISGRDILAVSINDFDRKPRYALSSTPLKSYSEKKLNINGAKVSEQSQVKKRKMFSSLSKSIILN